jgi:SAM-dependent methyltransferase
VSFDVAAESYDRFMGRYSQQLSAQLADLAGVAAGQRALDVGCGPGVLTGELVARLGADTVAAVDPSESFVVAARGRHPGVDVRQAPAEELPFDANAFDAALAQLVVHFMSDPVAGLGEMARVTRPGGVVVASVWDHVGGRAPISTLWRAADELGLELPDESQLPGVREGHLGELFRAAGLTEVEETEHACAVEYASFDEWWEPYTFGIGIAGGFVASLDEDGRDALRGRCRELLLPPFTIEAVTWAARGVVDA